MSIKREKSLRIIGYCSVLLMYSTFMINKAINLKRGSILSSSQNHSGKLSISALTPPAATEFETKQTPHKVSLRKTESINDFISKFEEILADPVAYENFAALIIKDGGVYCRRSQWKSLSRAKYYVEMLHEGFIQYLDYTELSHDQSIDDQILYNFTDAIPVILKHDDSNGCYPTNQHDKYKFPRLTWSIPSNNDNNWCPVVGMPSYKAWKDTNRSVKVDGMYWNHTFQENAREYPWDSKLNMAVWRGSTTFNKGLYGSLDFNDIPRAKLVQKGKESALIDAAFHKLVGKYQDDPNLQRSSKGKVTLKESIPLKEMMRYKAIIDIDGNNWSARFNSLLCSNSVVIKIQPDFVDPSFSELEPFVHYVPASIENLTETVEFVLSSKNEPNMKTIVVRANEWCRKSMTKTALVGAAIASLKDYEDLLFAYDTNWKKNMVSKQIIKNTNDLVQCDIQ